MYPKKELAQLVVLACEHYNIETVVISPGSRNAPLTVGFSNHPNIEALSVVDERCAAFFAMGIAQQKQKPVAIVCSSGSALLNYYPAIAEAFYSQIPLIVISADRPKHLIDVGDGQTIRQENVFDKHILYSANLVEDTKALEANTNKLSSALQIAVTKKGPVHINVPFDEPLYETVGELTTFKFPEITAIKTETNYNTEDLAEVWNKATKKLIVVGSNYPDTELERILGDLADNDESVLVFTETISNCNHPKFINSIDKLIFPLDDEAYQGLQPDVLITLGGLVVSKKIKQFLRKYQPQQHWHIDSLRAFDTYFCLNEHIKTTPVAFLKEFLPKTKQVSSDYQANWLAVKQQRVIQHKSYLESIEYSDLKVFEQVLQSIPKHSKVQISNSSTIRYSLLFDVDPSLQIFCNRGTSGIDGSTSTAVGAAYASKMPTVFITGDLSFFYDSNALWNSYIPANFRIIVFNNAGGGIFRFIPGPLTTNATEYFETPHNLIAEHLAKMYNFDYVKATDLKELNIGLADFYKESTKPKILEVFTPREINDVVLKQYFKNL